MWPVEPRLGPRPYDESQMARQVADLIRHVRKECDMAKATVTYKEIRFVIEGWRTRVFVLCEVGGDCPLGVQGWHAKDFPPSEPVDALIPKIFTVDDPVLWPQEAPTGGA